MLFLKTNEILMKYKTRKNALYTVYINRYTYIVNAAASKFLENASKGNCRKPEKHEQYAIQRGYRPKKAEILSIGF